VITDPHSTAPPSDTVACPRPACAAAARIVDRWTFGSTSGPVEHVKTGCERGHWFTPTVDSLDPPAASRQGQPIAGVRLLSG
jgi:hypothetical protein